MRGPRRLLPAWLPRDYLAAKAPHSLICSCHWRKRLTRPGESKITTDGPQGRRNAGPFRPGCFFEHPELFRISKRALRSFAAPGQRGRLETRRSAGKESGWQLAFALPVMMGTEQSSPRLDNGALGAERQHRRWGQHPIATKTLSTLF